MQTKSLKENLPEGESLIGSSTAIRELRHRIPKLSAGKSAILIEGESGTGKELVSKLIHQNNSPSDKPFISINCISNSRLPVESQLFGHVKRTLPAANQLHEGILAKAGTVVLKNIDLGSSILQNQILQFIEKGQISPLGGTTLQKVHARLIINTNVDLEETLRKDLYYVLSRVHIKIPPLRERKEDIPLLASYFLTKYSPRFNMVLSEDLLEKMRSYSWPGNVQELKDEIKRMAMISKGSQLLRGTLFQSPLHPLRVKDYSAPSSETISDSSESSRRLPHYRYTKVRHQSILELFNENKKVTRLQIVKQLKCSHTTASTDLKFLEQEGLIRRVITSGHLRTSYYVAVDSSLGA